MTIFGTVRKLTQRPATDPCISCGSDTGVPTSTHVDSRAQYVEGAGQLCIRCWRRIYDASDDVADPTGTSDS
jgi:hypothetical protein